MPKQLAGEFIREYRGYKACVRLKNADISNMLLLESEVRFRRRPKNMGLLRRYGRIGLAKR